MDLYHGSNVAVTSPEILITNHALDFGSGFYTTSVLEQAKKWAVVQTKRRETGIATVSIFEFDEVIAKQECAIKYFDAPNKEWLDFVTANRKKVYNGHEYDIVIGPVANDRTMPVITAYLQNQIDEDTALILLKPQKLANQYAFLTAKGLRCLTFKEVIYNE